MSPDDEIERVAQGAMDSLDIDESGSIYTPPQHNMARSIFKGRQFRDDMSIISSTRSVISDDLNYEWINGRRYCGHYYMPNDEEEQVRLQLMHQIFLEVFDGELTTIPLNDPKFILDIGTGIGEWAVGMADAFPHCDVLGTDISRIFAKPCPPNCFWEIADAEDSWCMPVDHFDLVHLRNLAGGMKDWDHIYRSAYETIRPGGWIEVLDFDDHKGLKNFLSWFPPDSPMHVLARDTEEASYLAGRPRGIGHLEPRLLWNAGFVEVGCNEWNIPFQQRESRVGKLWVKACIEGIEATALRLLTEHKGWKPEDVRYAIHTCAEYIAKLSSKPKKAKEFVMKVRVLTARKPDATSRKYSPDSIEIPTGNGDMLYGESEDGTQTPSTRTAFIARQDSVWSDEDSVKTPTLHTGPDGSTETLVFDDGQDATDTNPSTARNRATTVGQTAASSDTVPGSSPALSTEGEGILRKFSI